MLYFCEHHLQYSCMQHISIYPLLVSSLSDYHFVAMADELPRLRQLAPVDKLIKINLRTRLCLCFITLLSNDGARRLSLLWMVGLWGDCTICLPLLSPTVFCSRDIPGLNLLAHRLSDWSNGRRTRCIYVARGAHCHPRTLPMSHIVFNLSCQLPALRLLTFFLAAFQQSFFTFFLSPLIASSIYLFSCKASIC